MTQKMIGPNFGNELARAGLLGNHFSWFEDGTIEFFDDTTDTVKTAVLAIYAAHDPEKDDPKIIHEVKIDAGLTLSSVSTPALDGTYAVDDAAQQVITGIASGIASRNRLPGGGSTFNYSDSSGHPHPFGSADFLNFAAAVEDYVYALVQTQRTLSAGGSAEWPSPNVTIA